MNGARGVLATTARSSPLPLAARQEVSSFLELFEGVPASSALLKELCEQPLHAPELCVFTLTATTRVVLQWYTDFGALVTVAERISASGILMPLVLGWR